MPELPEVETIRRQLDEVLVGRTIVSVEVRREKSWSGKIDKVVGRKILGVERKAKVLFIATGNKLQATSYLMVHLKMTGQLIFEENDQISSNKSQTNSKVRMSNFKKTRVAGGHPTASWVNSLPDKHTRVVIGLDKGTLYFNDQRVFGWVRVMTNEQVEKITSKMPPDVIDRKMGQDLFYSILQRSQRAVKLVVMDSQKIGGVGNIYVCDGLFDAGIDPRRSAVSLSRVESDRLLKSLKKVVNLGIKLGGATASDEKYVQASGLGGKYQEKFLTYEREGEKCKRKGCGGVVSKFKLGGRGTYWCEVCQV